MSTRRAPLPLFLGLLALPLALSFESASNEAPRAVDFLADVRPVLQDNCTFCHGENARSREADLRLDTAQGLYGEREGSFVIVPGDKESSMLWQRIASEDDSERMPPAHAGLSLDEGDKELLGRWIEEGASYAAPVDYWTQIKPVLEERCIECHGEDEDAREADLRLDTREGLYGDLGGYAAITPGSLEDSEVWMRISDDGDPMPPEDYGEMLSADEQALFRRWIEEGAAFATEPSPIDWARDIEPLFRRSCYDCHGEDEDAREAELRVDTREGLFEDRGGYFALVAGDPDESEIWLRVSDDSDPMPPDDYSAMLSEDELELVRRWIEEGGVWTPR